ncbi:MAG: hypothetical protein EOO13_17000 [Chitinophagaceae bacterium]|nr:MAG: hypothetical protein EOO13_17000 [Chitinophagaceae bacterium]
MKNIRIKASVLLAALLYCLLSSFTSSAQEIPKVDNVLHDRMYTMMLQSENVVLPKEVAEKLTTINQNNPQKNKAVYLQASVLKVLYNKTLSKNDIAFFGEHILKSPSASIAAINTDIKHLLTLTR